MVQRDDTSPHLALAPDQTGLALASRRPADRSLLRILFTPVAEETPVLPGALAQKYPSAGRSSPWQWVFPATSTYQHPDTGQVRRHHLHETVIQCAVHESVLRAGIR